MTLTPLNCELRSPDQVRPGEWLSVHIFYAADRTPLLTRCVKPLIERLVNDELTTGHFFMRHWLEGPHLRLRIRPRFEHLSTVRTIIDDSVGDFLRREPSVYDPERDFDDELYKVRFMNEFAPEQWTERYGDGDRMPRHQNDTFDYFTYVPEVDRYGGSHGVELAERHAEHSSDLVIRLLETNNVHARTVLLGLSTQVMLTSAYAFMADPRHIARMFGSYLASWESMFSSEYERYERAYHQMSSTLGPRVERIHEAATNGTFEGLPAFVREWFERCVSMREQLSDAAREGSLRHPETGRQLSSLTDPDDSALSSLVRSYLHLTNNRLGITVSSENYLSYVLKRAIEDRFPY